MEKSLFVSSSEGRLSIIFATFLSESIGHIIPWLVVAAWLASECKAFGIIAGFSGWIAVIILSAVKEHFLDDEPEPMDACAAAYGGFLSLLIGVLKWIL